MAGVNGVEIKVGQVWRCRDGGVRTVTRYDITDAQHPWLAGGHWYNNAGVGDFIGIDLIELVKGEKGNTPADSPVSAPALLTAAAKHMNDRAATYDKPEGERSMAQTVAVFEAYHGIKLTEAQGWHFMQVLKDVRLFTRDSYHGDSAEDCIAYAALKAEAKAKAKAQEGGA